MAATIKKLQRAHFRALLKAEDAADKALEAGWAVCLSRLASGLAKLPEDGTVAEQRHAIEGVVADAFDALVLVAPTALATQAKDAIALGVSQGLAEIALQEARWGDGATAAAIETMTVAAPVVAAIESKALYEPFKAVFLELKARISLTTVSDAIEEAISAGENLRDAAKRLVGKVKGERWQLTRIARTEIGHAMNAGHAAAIEEVAARYPKMGVMQQWSSFFDAVTSAICRALHGQIRAPGEPFSALGESHDRPPARPNCRSRISPWAPHWDDAIQPRTEAQIAADEAAWQAERQAERDAARAARGKKSSPLESSFESFLLPGPGACCNGHH